MPRNPDLDKLLREVDDLTSSKQAPIEEEVSETGQPGGAHQGSSFLNKIGGFFISKVGDETIPVDIPPPTPHTVLEMAESEPEPEFTVDSDDMSGKDFSEIYAEAGIDESAFTVDKLVTLLQDPTLKDQPLSTKTLVVK